MKIGICGEYGSDNFGDAIIGYSLAHQIALAYPSLEVNAFDLSARNPNVQKAHADYSSSIIQKIHRWFYASFYFYASLLNLLVFKKNNFLDYYLEQLKGCDAVLIGGGQLLLDSRLSFPLKLEQLVKASELSGVKVTFFSVGVGSNWSLLAKSYLRRILNSKSVENIYCRDSDSALKLRELLPEVSKKIIVTVDLALGLPFLDNDKSDRVSLCLMSPLAIRRIVPNHPLSGYKFSDDFWAGLVNCFVSNGVSVDLFCNGADEDVKYLNYFLNKNRISDDDDINVFIPKSYDELIGYIASSKAIVAARMHANIVAFRMGVPSIAIEWDAKVRSFMNDVGRSDYCIPASGLSIKNVFDAYSAENFFKSPDSSRFENKVLTDLKAAISELGID